MSGTAFDVALLLREESSHSDERLPSPTSTNGSPPSSPVASPPTAERLRPPPPSTSLPLLDMHGLAMEEELPAETTPTPTSKKPGDEESFKRGRRLSHVLAAMAHTRAMSEDDGDSPGSAGSAARVRRRSPSRTSLFGGGGLSPGSPVRDSMCHLLPCLTNTAPCARLGWLLRLWPLLRTLELPPLAPRARNVYARGGLSSSPQPAH